ncbi:right-handed parallel beta-helix repeat-containing protein [Spirosoma rhododendri]|uniref:DUF11 domain-containing protein n=1 Tax=Spirosoma rhododendri TaxID=2728024 RepID=A0A7L5DS66_9BACT|nr:right-handed parallel beta-helix repeat-containing protein [Spirosoma rhododendri]QJD80452.1 DUF11 domain-containing protein [Spirosoma rhododendri]
MGLSNARIHRFPTLLNTRFYSASRPVGWLTLVCSLLFASADTFAQTTYYIASTGSDTNTGQSSDVPFQTLNKINSLTLKAGDAILFRRGDTFTGTLTIRQAGSPTQPIRVDAYGTGQPPRITGALPLTDWTQVGTNRWQAPCPSCGSRVTALFRDDGQLPLGRFPNPNDSNKGYLTIQSHSGKTQLTSQQPLTTNWTGAEAVVRPVQWILDRAIITGQNGNTLSLTNNTNYNLADGWGYFIQNHPATLDQNGEWYYDPNAKTIQLYATEKPASGAVTATAFDEALLITANYVTVQNIHLIQARKTNLRATNATGLTLTGLRVSNGGEDGVYVEGSGSNVLIQDVQLDNVNNNGITTGPYQNVTIRRSTVRAVGVQAGRGRSGDGQSVGILSSGSGGLLLEDNVLDSLGFNGICFVNNALIQRNIISNFCLTKSDGGGIYVWNGNKLAMSNNRILSNIVYGGTGAAAGTPGGAYSGANGIYLDDCTYNIDVKANTVFGCAGLGIFLHATNNTTVSGNTSIDNGEGQFKISHNNGGCPARSNTVQSNLFVSKTATQLVAAYESLSDDLASYGTFNKNTYARPFDDLVKIRAVKGVNGSIIGNDLTLGEWQTQSGQDLASTNSPITYRNYTVTRLGATRLNQTFDTNNGDWSSWGPNNNTQVVQDRSGKLDGNCLRVGFTGSSGQRDSFLYAFVNVGTVTKGKQYLLRFDAIGSGAGQKIPFFLRQRDGGYRDLSSRKMVWIGADRQHYEMAFTATDNEPTALLVTQLAENGQTVWFDNVSINEVDLSVASPSDSIYLAYNPTTRDSLIQLNNLYRNGGRSSATTLQTNSPSVQSTSQTVQVSPFSSVVLMRSSTPMTGQGPVDLSLRMCTRTRMVRLGSQQTIQITLRNEDRTPLTGRVQWSCRLPANLTLVAAPGMTYQDGLLTGSAYYLDAGSDTTFTITVSPKQPGCYRVAAQISYSPLPDPDSSPNSGTADGEDDTAVIDSRTDEEISTLFESPNPSQLPLPAVVSNQPAPNSSYTDLSVATSIDKTAAALGDIVSLSLTVANTGGSASGPVQLRYQLPAGLQLVDGQNWTNAGATLTTSLSNLPTGSQQTVWFRARVIQTGTWITNAEVFSCQTPDIDSTPANGYTNGEDDQTQLSLRVF